jgi:hypothetical protein
VLTVVWYYESIVESLLSFILPVPALQLGPLHYLWQASFFLTSPHLLSPLVCLPHVLHLLFAKLFHASSHTRLSPCQKDRVISRDKKGILRR